MGLSKAKTNNFPFEIAFRIFNTILKIYAISQSAAQQESDDQDFSVDKQEIKYKA